MKALEFKILQWLSLGVFALAISALLLSIDLANSIQIFD
jgi:hypothetical protein